MKAVPADHISLAGRSAILSPCGAYRYYLHRFRIDIVRPRHTATFLLLNPSTADARVDDATVRKCWRYAMSWGMTDMVFVNTNPFRSRDPKHVPSTLPNAVKRRNEDHIEEAARHSDVFVGAWSSNAWPMLVAGALVAVKRAGKTVYALDVAISGAPKHPLYLPGDLRPVPWVNNGIY